METLDASSTETSQIKKLLEEWGKGLLTLSASNFVRKFYTNDALLIPTISNTLCVSFADKVGYFKKFLQLKPQLQVDTHSLTLADQESALDAGLYTFHFPEQESLHARYSFFYKKNKDCWMITHHHSSLFPN